MWLMENSWGSSCCYMVCQWHLGFFIICYLLWKKLTKYIDKHHIYYILFVDKWAVQKLFHSNLLFIGQCSVYHMHILKSTFSNFIIFMQQKYNFSYQNYSLCYQIHVYYFIYLLHIMLSFKLKIFVQRTTVYLSIECKILHDCFGTIFTIYNHAKLFFLTS